ncbi:hypothetical protein Aperf_G00000044393 [Anoplocephala perfoliata]
MSDGFFSSKFWSDKFWLPLNETWVNVETPHCSDLIYCVFSGIILCILRVILCNYVFTPIGLSRGLRPRKVKQVPYIPLLEEFYQTNKRPSCSDIQKLSKKIDISEVRVSNWFRSRRNSTKFPIIVKFVECGWRFSFYFSMFCYGIYCLYKEPFLYDTTYYFRAYPHHQMSLCIFWYYTIEFSNYVTGLIWIFLEVKRKDFAVMFTHHIVTVTLIIFSFFTNYFRIGSVIMLLHDSADFWLEAAKMFRYVGMSWPCMFCFVTFIGVWIVTRLCFFPIRVISSLIFVAPKEIGYYPALNCYLAFLVALQILHVFWTIQIIRTAVKPFITGQPTSDARSDSEMSDSEPESVNNTHCNGVSKRS